MNVDILSDTELAALEGSSGDDCDMAAVKCVVRELRQLRRVVEASIAMRTAEGTDYEGPVETVEQVEALKAWAAGAPGRTYAALIRWRTIVDQHIEATRTKEG